MIKLVPQAEAMTFGHLQIFSLSLQEYVQCFQSLFKFMCALQHTSRFSAVWYTKKFKSSWLFQALLGRTKQAMALVIHTISDLNGTQSFQRDCNLG